MFFGTLRAIETFCLIVNQNRSRPINNSTNTMGATVALRRLLKHGSDKWSLKKKNGYEQRVCLIIPIRFVSLSLKKLPFSSTTWLQTSPNIKRNNMLWYRGIFNQNNGWLRDTWVNSQRNTTSEFGYVHTDTLQDCIVKSITVLFFIFFFKKGPILILC